MNDKKDWVEFQPGEVGDLGTKHLPVDVVKQKVVLGIWVTTDPENNRKGKISIGTTIGGRNNPQLTEEEFEYLNHILDYAESMLKKKVGIKK